MSVIKNMKRMIIMRKMMILIILSFSIVFFDCDTAYPLDVFNKADYPIEVLSQDFEGLEATYNPVWTNHPGFSAQTAFPGEFVGIFSWGGWSNRPALQDSGYIKIFVFDTMPQKDTLCIYYMEEWSINKCHGILFFPPTEQMKDYKMWPPYGTYDENGHRVAQ